MKRGVEGCGGKVVVGMGMKRGGLVGIVVREVGRGI